MQLQMQARSKYIPVSSPSASRFASRMFLSSVTRRVNQPHSLCKSTCKSIQFLQSAPSKGFWFHQLSTRFGRCPVPFPATLKCVASLRVSQLRYIRRCQIICMGDLRDWDAQNGNSLPLRLLFHCTWVASLSSRTPNQRHRRQQPNNNLKNGNSVNCWSVKWPSCGRVPIVVPFPSPQQFQVPTFTPIPIISHSIIFPHLHTKWLSPPPLPPPNLINSKKLAPGIFLRADNIAEFNELGDRSKHHDPRR